MRVTFKPAALAGTLTAPPSKSVAHRYLIAAALAKGESRIRGISGSEDMLATMDVLTAFGAECRKIGDTVLVTGADARKIPKGTTACCRESGSTLRFLLPIALLADQNITLTGSERLFARPLDIYEEICRERSLRFERNGASVTVCGPLSGGSYCVAGGVSSQFITGLLYALPLCKEDSTLRILPPVESRPYLALTLNALRRFGIRIDQTGDDTYRIPGAQTYLANDATVEGDYSNAAFFDAHGILGGDVRVLGLDSETAQGDAVYRTMFPALENGCPTLQIGDCPDLGPILMALAAAKHGAVLEGTHRLKIKESDRGAAMAGELAKFGARVTVEDDRITVSPSDFHAPTASLYGHNDHRIVMALSTLLTKTGGVIEGAEAVRKSLPEYFEMLQSLGAEVTINEA